MIFGNPSIVTNGLILNLDAANTKSYPGTGTSWRDLSGNNNTGTLTNSPTFSRDGGGSIVFNGTNQSANVGNINPISGATFSAWININGANTNYGTIFSRWNISGNAFFIGTNINASSQIQVYFNSILNLTITSLELNKWMLLTISHSGSTVIAYINAIQTNSAASSLVSGGGTTSIGYDINRTNYPFKGNISNTQIYNRALTASEIQQNYNALKSRFNLR
jgi:hypothetical protein